MNPPRIHLVGHKERRQIIIIITLITQLIYVNYGPTPQNVLESHIYDNRHDYAILHDMLVNEEVKFPLVVLSQIMLETAWLTSAHFVRGNNCCGMKINSRPYGTYQSTKECKTKCTNCVDCIHAHYPALISSIRDLKAWQDIRMKIYTKYTKREIKTVEEYQIFLDNLVLVTKHNHPYFARYAEDPKYRQKVSSIMLKLSPAITTGTLADS